MKNHIEGKIKCLTCWKSYEKVFDFNSDHGGEFQHEVIIKIGYNRLIPRTRPIVHFRRLGVLINSWDENNP